jgi:hypothetical protein
MEFILRRVVAQDSEPYTRPGKAMRTMRIFALAFSLSLMLLVEVRGQPYKGESFPSDVLMLRSVKRFLENTGRLSFGDVRLLGRRLSPDGLLQLFFCAGVARQPFDVTRQRSVPIPKWPDDRAAAVRDISVPLETSLDCTIFEVLRLDTGTWILRQDTRFLVIEE